MVSLAFNPAQAQVTDDFETTSCPTTPCQGVISSGCLTNWKTSHGSPYITLIPADAYNNDHALRMDYEANPGGSWGGGGAFRSYAFKEDKCYKIKFWRRYKIGQVAAKFYAYLGNGLTEDATFTNCYDPVPTGSGPFELVYSEYLPVFQTPTWQEITLQFIPNNDYDYLWLYVEPETTPPSQSGGEYTVDLLRIGESDNAPVADFSHFTYPANDICEGVVVFENLSEGCEGYTSTWDFGDGSPTSSEENPSHTYSSSGTYTVTLTIECPDGGCSDTETYMVTVTGGTYDFTVNGPITLTAAILGTMLPSGGVSNASVKINGVLTVDDNYFFDNADLIFASGAGIDKVTSSTLTISNGSNLTSCDRLWRGIWLIDGTLDIDDSFISNAVTGINFYTCIAAHLELTHTSFDRNVFGVYAKGGPSFFTIGSFFGNRFDCTAPLLPVSPAAPTPLYGPRSYAGVHISNSDNSIVVPIGVTGQAPNEFVNLCNGIITEDVLTLTVLNTRFENILLTNDYVVPTGYGIWCRGSAISNSALWQDGIPFDNPAGVPSFENCTQAIRVQTAETQVYNNVMREVVFGIRVETARERFIVLQLNDIECERMGIELLDNDPSRHLWVSQNTIVTGAGLFGLVSGGGIGVRETGIYQPSAQILNSVIDLHQWNTGIQMTATNNYLLHNNAVDMSPSLFPISGLWVAGGTDNELACNSVLGNGIGSGLYTTDAKGTIWICNIVERTKEGAFFRDACTGSRLTTTRFIPPFSNSGLLYISPVILGNQPHRGNLWNAGTYTNSAAQWVGVASGLAASFESYLIHTTSTPFYPPSFNLPVGVAPLDWFPAPIPGTPDVCAEETECDEIGFTGDEEEDGREMRSRIASGEYDNLPSYGTVAWRAKQQVFAQLEANPELQNESPEVAEFYQNNQQSLLGGLHQVEKGIAQLYKLMPELRESIGTHQETIREKAAALSQINAAILAGGDHDNELAEQRAALLQEIRTLGQEAASWSAEVIAAQRTQADELIAANAALEVTTDYQANEKAVNAIHLATLAKDTVTFTAEQAEILRVIAEQCPRDGGIGVYKARSLYALIVHVDYNDDELCASAALQQVQAPQVIQSESPENKFKVFPNPNNGVFTVEYQVDHPTWLTIYDLAGRQVYSQVLNTDRSRVDFSTGQLQPGVFILKILEEGRTVYTEKLIIIH